MELSSYDSDVNKLCLRIVPNDYKILTQVSRPVQINEQSELEKVRQIVDYMFNFIEEKQGLGISGVQLGVLSRFFVLHCPDADNPSGRYNVKIFDGKYKLEDGYKSTYEHMCAINPEIISVSEKRHELLEGCLSIPNDVRFPVIRPLSITVSFYDISGNKVIEKLTGYPAKCFQHELDHLNGLMTIHHQHNVYDALKKVGVL